MKPIKLLLMIAVIAAAIALYFKVNVPELKDAAGLYFEMILFALVVFLAFALIFKGKFKLK